MDLPGQRHDRDQDGLTLTVGQTYFFSVQAVNGAGLTGSATNSNGQTVVSQCHNVLLG